MLLDADSLPILNAEFGLLNAIINRQRPQPPLADDAVCLYDFASQTLQ